MLYKSLVIMSLLATSACISTGAPSQSAGIADVAIRNVTVIDPASGTRRAGRDVLIDDGRIVAVVASSGADRPAETQIDGTGRFVMPGLMDMHVHSNLRPIHESTLALLLANGVTGVRDMGSDCQRPGGIAMCLAEMRASADAITAGTLFGPRQLQLSSSKILTLGAPERADDPARVYYPQNAEEGRATAATLIARQPGILKTGDHIEAGAYLALIAAAHSAGVRVGGHLPVAMSVADAARAGQDSIEHARDLPLDCAIGGAAFRREASASIAAGRRPEGRGAARAALAVAGQDAALCADQIAAMVRAGTYYVPTHLTREMDFRAGEAAYRDDPLRAYVHPQLWRRWEQDLGRTAEATPEEVAAFREFFRLGLALTGRAHRAGVLIMAGTDANDTMVVPGFSLHRELGFLVEAGLSPMAALQAATSVPARYLGRTTDMGGVSPGMVADLLLLRADPLADIANSRQIEAVIFGGRVRDRAALDLLLDQARAAATVPPRSG